MCKWIRCHLIQEIRDAQTWTSSYTYDQENRQKAATIPKVGGGSVTTTYTYDGEGRRVKASTPNGRTVTYVYDAFGQLTAEYSDSAVAAAATRYLVADALGSTRLAVSPSGAAKCYDYVPFGGEIGAGSAGRTAGCFGDGAYPSAPDGVSMKFTGKERDAETGLDYFGARYMAAAQGRFTSPDTLGFSSTSSPQSWNSYNYSSNNPLSRIDPTGHQDYPVCMAEPESCRARREGEKEMVAKIAKGTVNALWHVVGTGLTFEPVGDIFPPQDLGDQVGNVIGGVIVGEAFGGSVLGGGSTATGPKALFHYTTEESAAGIAESGAIRPSTGGPTSADMERAYT